MSNTEIRYFSGYRQADGHLVRGEEIIEPEIIQGEDAIAVGSKRIKAILEYERTNWLLQASIQRDFEDNLTAKIFLLVGPALISQEKA